MPGELRAAEVEVVEAPVTVPVAMVVETAETAAVETRTASMETVVVGPAAVEASEVASGLPAIAKEAEGTSDEAAKAGAELGSGSSSSFSYEDSEEESEETVLEMRSEAGLDEVGPAVEPEARPVDPLIVQFGEDDDWWRNMVDFVQREAEGGVRDPLDYWRDQIH